MSIFKAVTTVGGYTGLSRIFGMIREILMSHFLGAGLLADAFVVAFKFPNFFRRFFAEGAFNAAFVPIFASELATHGKNEAKKIASDVFSVMAIALFFFCILVMMATPLLMPILAPGFGTTPERLTVAIEFIRITFPYLLLISLTALLGGILNSIDKFASAAAAPILLNIIMIASLLMASVFDWNPGHSLCYGVFVAGILQCAWLYGVCYRYDFHPILKWPTFTIPVKRVLKHMGPGTLGAGVMQVNIFIDLMLASFLPTGALSYLYYADRLNQLPLSVFGIAISTALLPMLSKQLKGGEHKSAKNTTSKAIHFALQLTMPATIGLVVMADPIIALIYGHGKFTLDAIQATAPTLAAFAVGLPGYVVGKVLSTCFFARQDTKTPVKIACISVAINLACNLALIHPLQHIGLALSTGIAAWANAILLAYVMHKKGWYTLWTKTFVIFSVKLILACALMALSIYYAASFFARPITVLDECIIVFSLILAAILSYITASFFLKLLPRSISLKRSR